MERNDRDSIHPNTGGEQTSFGSQLNSNFGGTTGGFSETGTSSGSDTSSFAGTAGSTSSRSEINEPTNTGSGGVTGKVKSVASTVKDKASNLPAMLADGLQAGAQALRQRRTSLAATDGTATTTVADTSSIVAVTDTLADGMQSSAEWLRDADLDKIKDGLETQVKEHPARTLLIALGAGYLLGKAFRR